MVVASKRISLVLCCLMRFKTVRAPAAGSRRGDLRVCCAGVIALLMTDLPFYTDPVKYPNTYLSSPLIPVLLSLLIGYIVASIFFNVRSAAAFILALTMMKVSVYVTLI